MIGDRIVVPILREKVCDHEWEGAEPEGRNTSCM